jgi:hypothetical protein
MISTNPNQTLLIECNSFVAVTLQINAIGHNPNGGIVPYQRNVSFSNTDGATQSFSIPLHEGTIDSIVITTSTQNIFRGQCFIRCSVTYSLSGVPTFQQLFSDYITTGTRLGYPFSPIKQSQEGVGFLTSTQFDNTTPYTATIYTLHNQRIKILHFFTAFDATADSGTTNITLSFTPTSVGFTITTTIFSNINNTFNGILTGLQTPNINTLSTSSELLYPLPREIILSASGNSISTFKLTSSDFNGVFSEGYVFYEAWVNI